MVIARNSNLLGKITFLVVVGLCVNTALALLDGSGTQEDPWLIQSLDDFNDFAADANYWDWDDYTRLETDVNLAGMVYDRAVIAGDWDGDFAGVFDGNDHVVSNFTCDSNGVGEGLLVGLFGSVATIAEIKNLGLINPSLTLPPDDSHATYVRCGSLVADSWGKITNCFAEGVDVNMAVTYAEYSQLFIGGLIGHSSGLITGCHSTGNLSTMGDGACDEHYCGGLVGIQGKVPITKSYSTVGISSGYVETTSAGGLVGSSGSTVTDCYATGAVVSAGGECGGLIGYNLRGVIINSYSTGNIQGGFYYIGGFVGWNVGGSITNCYSTGSASGRYQVGGLVGENRGGSITNSYSTGSVDGQSNVGGLVGRNGYDGPYGCDDGEIYASYWDIESSGEPNMCGYQEDCSSGCDNSYGLPTSQLQIRSTFTDADWDFINVWNIGENQTYPYLRVYLPSDINKDGIVNFLDLSITANQWLKEQ
jgi:hypothetical protein